MNNDRFAFRERLLEIEQATPALKRQYEKELHAMFEKQTTGVRRWSWLAAAILGVVFACVFGTLAIVLPAEFPISGRIGFAAGALFGVGYAILGIRVFRRGVINLKTDTAAAAGMAWAMVVIQVTLFMMSAPDSIVGLRMILCGLVFLVMGLAFLVRHVVEQSELKTRERLLELEYRLASLTEAVQGDKPSSPENV